MTVTLNNPLDAVLASLPLIVFGYYIVKGTKAKAQDLALATAQKEADIYKSAKERLEAQDSEKSQIISDLKAIVTAKDKQLQDLTGLIRQDTVSPALLAILEKIAAGNAALYQAAMVELRHYVEDEFKAVRQRLDAIEGTAREWTKTAERRAS